MEVKLENELNSIAVFRLVRDLDMVKLQANFGNGFVSLATFRGGADQAFLYIDRMKKAGFSVYRGDDGQVL